MILEEKKHSIIKITDDIRNRLLMAQRTRECKLTRHIPL